MLPATNHNGERLHAHYGRFEEQESGIYGKCVLKVRPSALARFLEGFRLRELNPTACCKDRIPESIPSRPLIVKKTGKMQAKLLFKPEAV